MLPGMRSSALAVATLKIGITSRPCTMIRSSQMGNQQILIAPTSIVIVADFWMCQHDDFLLSVRWIFLLSPDPMSSLLVRPAWNCPSLWILANESKWTATGDGNFTGIL